VEDYTCDTCEGDFVKTFDLKICATNEPNPFCKVYQSGSTESCFECHEGYAIVRQTHQEKYICYDHQTIHGCEEYETLYSEISELSALDETIDFHATCRTCVTGRTLHNNQKECRIDNCEVYPSA
jgi:hypothetical protein